MKVCIVTYYSRNELISHLDMVEMDGIEARPYALTAPLVGNLALPNGELSEPSIPSLRLMDAYDDRLKPQRRDSTLSLRQSGTDNIAKFNVCGMRSVSTL